MASLTGFITAIIITFSLVGISSGKDLRPSDHGLGYQSSPPANSPPDMKSFFNSNNSSSSSSYASLWNLTDSVPPETSGNGRGRLGKALVMASLVCGITGVILLVVSVLLFLFWNKRRNSEQNDSFRVDDIDECEYFSSKDACTQEEQRLVLFNFSESDTDQDGSSIESSLRSYTARNCASSKKRLRRSPLLDKQGRVEIGYTLHYQTPSPQSSYPKKRLKRHSYSDSCERNSLDCNMSECQCNLESPCYCFVYNEIEMFEYTGSESCTNVLHQKTCDCLTTTYSRDLTLTMPSKWMENYKENLAMTFSCPSPRPKHVHPKLPDYDDFVATFKALKRECNLRRQ